LRLNAIIDVSLRAQRFSAVGETVESDPIRGGMIPLPLFGGGTLVDVGAMIREREQFGLLDERAGGIHNRHHDINELNQISRRKRLGREKSVQLIFRLTAEGLRILASEGAQQRRIIPI
jgi:hypothetical protein